MKTVKVRKMKKPKKPKTPKAQRKTCAGDCGCIGVGDCVVGCCQLVRWAFRG
jgi:hypothetical protein